MSFGFPEFIILFVVVLILFAIIRSALRVLRRNIKETQHNSQNNQALFGANYTGTKKSISSQVLSNRSVNIVVPNKQDTGDLSQPIITVQLSPDTQVIQAATEIVKVPRGVTVSVKRSRTYEHTISINWNQSIQGKVDAGLKQIVSASIMGEIEKAKGRSYQQSETVEYNVELKGDITNQYKLVWTENWLKGVAEVKEDNRNKSLSFDFRESSVLEVVPVN